MITHSQNVITESDQRRWALLFYFSGVKLYLTEKNYAWSLRLVDNWWHITKLANLKNNRQFQISRSVNNSEHWLEVDEQKCYIRKREGPYALFLAHGSCSMKLIVSFSSRSRFGQVGPQEFWGWSEYWLGSTFPGIFPSKISCYICMDTFLHILISAWKRRGQLYESICKYIVHSQGSGTHLGPKKL